MLIKFNKMKKMMSVKRKKKSLISFLMSSGIAKRVTTKMIKEISLSIIISAATFLTGFLPGGFFLKFIVGNCIRYTTDVLFNPVNVIKNGLKYVSRYIPYQEMQDIDFIKNKLEKIRTMYFEMSNFELIPPTNLPQQHALTYSCDTVHETHDTDVHETPDDMHVEVHESTNNTPDINVHETPDTSVTFLDVVTSIEKDDDTSTNKCISLKKQSQKSTRKINKYL